MPNPLYFKVLWLFKNKSDLEVVKAIRNKVDISYALFRAFLKSWLCSVIDVSGLPHLYVASAKYGYMKGKFSYERKKY